MAASVEPADPEGEHEHEAGIAWKRWAHELWEWLSGDQDDDPPKPPPIPQPPAPPTNPGTPTPTGPTGPTTPLPPVTITVAWMNDDTAVSDADVAIWVDAMNAQVPHVQALWPHVVQCTHVFVPTGQKAPAGAVPATLRPTIPEAPGALAYHDIDEHGNPYIVVGSQTTLKAGVSIPSAMSHEAVELTVDPGCAAVAVAPNGDRWALEISDPVEADTYFVTTTGGASVEVSDFVGEAFFGQGAGALDHQGKATAAFAIAPGGYAVINGQQVSGATKVGAERRPPIGPVPRAKEEATAA